MVAGQELLCACVVSYQSFGGSARFNPDWHVHILEGGFSKYDRFVYLPIGDDDGMLKFWQSAILSLFFRKKLIDQERVKMLLDWKHSGFSIESETRLFSKADREALGQYVVRGATCAEKIQYDPESDTVVWAASPKGFYKSKSETFKGYEFVDQLLAHLSPRRVQPVRRYGVYVGKVRKQWRDRPSIYLLAHVSYRQSSPPQSKSSQGMPPVEEVFANKTRYLGEASPAKLGSTLTKGIRSTSVYLTQMSGNNVRSCDYRGPSGIGQENRLGKKCRSVNRHWRFALVPHLNSHCCRYKKLKSVFMWNKISSQIKSLNDSLAELFSKDF
ncbi:MAG: transposase [Methanosarcinaceae archaeon]|nr:transposase [Methanosarcinaceae archaeon]